MTDQQKEFLHLCVVEQQSVKAIAETLGVPKPLLTEWYDALKEERLKIAAVRTLWGRKKIETPFPEFYAWYSSNERKCFYCGITEREIKELIDGGRLATKRLATRGRKLELDRKQADLVYSELENIVLSCYWCNNAKTDTFTAEEFLQVGQAFRSIWENRLNHGNRQRN